MDSNPIDEGITSGRIEATDDVEGHMPRIRILDAEQGDDESVEGHGIPKHVDRPDTDDVEGHGLRGNAEAGADDDTEGHGVSSGR